MQTETNPKKAKEKKILETKYRKKLFLCVLHKNVLELIAAIFAYRFWALRLKFECAAGRRSLTHRISCAINIFTAASKQTNTRKPLRHIHTPNKGK